MPRVFGTNIFGILLAAIVMYVIGGIFYGALFTEQWMEARGYTEAMFEGKESLQRTYMLAAFVLELTLAFGLAWLLSKLRDRSIGACLGAGLIAGLLIGLPLTSYEYAYGLHHDPIGLLVDWGHRLSMMVAGAGVLSFFND